MKKRWYILLLLTIITSVISVVWVQISSPVIPQQRRMAEFRFPTVSVLTVNKTNYTPIIDRFGLAKAARVTTIPAKVSGEIVKIYPDFTRGKRIKKNTPLAMTDGLTYTLAVAEKEKALMDAKIEYQLEEQRKIQAMANWERLGRKKKKMSPLVSRKFHIEAAKAKVEACSVALDLAKSNLAHTTIFAPYDAAIISKEIALGEYVAVGQAVGKIYDSSLMEVHFPLSAINISKLGLSNLDPSGAQNKPVKIISTSNTNNYWNGTLKYLDLQVSVKTRETIAIAEVVDPLNTNPPLLPNTFVQIEIAGKELRNVFALPEKSITQDGYIWSVNDENKLEKLLAEVLFRKDGVAYIKNIKSLSQIKIVLNPMGIYTEGLLVSHKEAVHE